MQQVTAMTRLQAYIKTFALSNNVAADLSLIEQLQKQHLSRFSFNNITVLLENTPSLDLEIIIEKIVDEGRGGYCFEHNKLMFEMLKYYGYDVKISLAKVLNNQEIEAPRTHRVSIVTFKEEKYLVDVGFGHVCPRTPLKLLDKTNEKDDYQAVSNGDGSYTLMIKRPRGFFRLYTFDLADYDDADCLMGNFYSANYKDAAFLNNLVISRITEEVTYSLKNLYFYTIKGDAQECMDIKNEQDFQEVLKTYFMIGLSKNEVQTLFAKASDFHT